MAIIPSFLLLACSLAGVDDLRSNEETLLLQQPSVSENHVVFVYAKDLWVASRRGGDARRLTSSPGDEGAPYISPDGRWVAFTGAYEGNTDVYVIPIEGGAPRRLTWHPDADIVQGWTPEGTAILFTSRRASGAPVNQLFTVGMDGGMPDALPIPKAAHAAIDPEGKRIAYTAIADAFRTWKRYRGGRTPQVWIYDRASHAVEVVPHENASDTFPCWLGSDVYFASDRDGTMDIWRYRSAQRDLQQITHYDDFDVRSMSAGAGVIAYEQAGAIHIYDPRRGAPERLRIRVPADGVYGLPRWQSVRGHVRDGAISPNGKRAVFEARGEIITVPKEHGDVRNITNTADAHERSPSWSRDGEWIAYLTDASGEYQLAVRDQLGRSEPKFYDLGGAGFYYRVEFSPDGKRVLFTDKANQIGYVTLETGAVTRVAKLNGSLGTIQPAAVWSPDSRWIAFESRNPNTMYDHIALFDTEDGRTYPVTNDFAHAAQPAFSTDGKYLFFTASVDPGPNLFGLDMSASASRDSSNGLYVAVLSKETGNPLFPRTDEGRSDDKNGDKDSDKQRDRHDGDKTDPSDRNGDKADPSDKDADDKDRADDGGDKDGGDKDGGDKDGGDKAKKKGAKPVHIDVDGLDQRVLALPVSGDNFRSLACIKDQLLFVERGEGRPELKSFSFESREVSTLLSGVRGFAVSGDGKSLLVATSGWAITNTSGKDSKSLGIDSAQVRVDPEKEWPQILREVWRIQRDYFYDPNLHGVDWDAMWERWSAMLPHVRHRDDLTMVIGELIGELACGHQYVSGGEGPDGPSGTSVGLLGADFVIDQGRYQISKILTGQNWNPSLRAPLTEPGVDARQGDYLLAVDGRPLTSDQNLYAAFETRAGETVELTLGQSADGSESRTVKVVPIRSEGMLRRMSWVEDNRRRVDELSGGKLAYIYMPNTGSQGRAAFDRDFYSQIDRLGVVIDERYNGGGQVADYVIDILSRDVITYWMNREQWVGRSPFGLIDGPKVMVINEYAGSGGDWMPWAFQQRGLGPLVGKRTWGGLVGISGYPPLVDGGSVTAANFGVMDAEGRWAIENVGVEPDVMVEEWPDQVIAGRDPQLEEAVRIAMEALRDHKRKPMPAYVPPEKR